MSSEFTLIVSFFSSSSIPLDVGAAAGHFVFSLTRYNVDCYSKSCSIFMRSQIITVFILFQNKVTYYEHGRIYYSWACGSEMRPSRFLRVSYVKSVECLRRTGERLIQSSAEHTDDFTPFLFRFLTLSNYEERPLPL